MAHFPKILLNRLWHSTSIDRFNNILKDGVIKPEPDLPDSVRWCTGLGPMHYPYVRTLGGVSLFDFSGFVLADYEKEYSSSWYTFVPNRHGGGNKIWIEINREAVKDSLILGQELITRWEEEKAYGHNIMPIIEIAHLGPIQTSKFVRALSYESGKWNELSFGPLTSSDSHTRY